MYSARPKRPEEPTRDEWVHNNHLSTQLWVVFGALESLRCPNLRRRASGRMRRCGGYLGQAPDWAREAVVRVAVGGPVISNSEHRLKTCRSCRKMIEVFLVRKPQELEATG